MGIAVLGVSSDAAFDVVVYGFDATTESPVEGLVRVFGLKETDAEALLNAMPAIVCRRVNFVRAEHYCRALRSIGARIEVLDERGGRVPLPQYTPSRRPSSSAAVRASLPPSAAANHNGREPTLRYGQPSTASRAPKTALPSLAAAARGPVATAPTAWGELMREPAHTPSQRAPQPEERTERHGFAGDPAEYNALSLPAEADAQPPLELELAAPPPRKPLKAAQPAALKPAAVQPDNAASQVRRAEKSQPRAAEETLTIKHQPRFARDGEPEADFWQALPEALLFPWRDRGVAWFISIGLWAVFANVLSVLAQAVPFIGTSFVLMVNTSVLALCADYHRRCLWAVVNGEEALHEGPDFDPARVLHGYMRSGIHLALFALVSQLPLVAWISRTLLEAGSFELRDLMLSWPFWCLIALPVLYWPMAVATASLYNQFQGVWQVGVGLRAVLRAPSGYLGVALLGAVTLAVPWVLCWAIWSALGLPASFFLTTAGLPLAASHAVMGALTGQLMRAHPRMFETA